MRLAIFIALSVITPATAQSVETLPCVDATSMSAYNARPVSAHEILLRNATGSDRRSLRLGTTCLHIDRTAIVSVRSLNQCVAKGDDVAAVSIDGQRELCKVSNVTLGEDFSLTKYK